MGTTAEKLNKVLETKEAIRTSINNKGGTLTESDTFSSYATAIDNIQTGSGENPLQLFLDTRKSASYLFASSYWSSGITYRFGFDTMSDEMLEAIIANISFSNVTEMCYMFLGCKALTTIPLLDTSNVTDMSSMFQSCSSLITIPLLDTSKVTRMVGMFEGCNNLTSIPALNTSSCTITNYMFNRCSKLTTIPLLDTSKVTNMQAMFYGCNNLISVPALNTSNVTKYMDQMFRECYKLEKIDITNLISGTSKNNAFAYDCYSLKTLIIHTMDTIPELSSDAFYDCYHFYGTYNSTYNPTGAKDGAIYVPDDKVEALKVATNWSRFANIIKPLSEYVEE